MTMKTRLDALSKYFGTMYKRLECSKNWQHALTGERSMIGYLNRLPIVLLGRSGRSWILGIVSFVRFALKTKSHMGLRGLSITLKVAHTLLVKAVARGKPVRAMSDLGHRVATTGRGIPRLIPVAHRKAILRGNGSVIRFWLSLLSLYRITEYKGKMNIRTITSPGRNFDLGRYESFISVFFMRIPSRFHLDKLKVVKLWEPKLITKSGPGVVSAERKIQPMYSIFDTTAAMLVQAIALVRDTKLLEAFKALAACTGQSSLVKALLHVEKHASQIPEISSVTVSRKIRVGRKPRIVKTTHDFVPTYLGRLGAKEEPGKVRVFAMVDWWTQMLLRPIHLMLFEILKSIPQDATFDQEKGVEEGRQMIKKSKIAYSFDLSAATDRLPVSLQSKLIEWLIPGAGEAWRYLLVGRKYSTPVHYRKLGMKVPEAVTYAVGQPMGALSSWAMLALTHHFIVQYAAWKEGWPRWFTLYLVLGDDIVIFEKKVALRYLCIMKDLGVGINLVKSVVSKDTFEFAKRIIHQDSNLSPASFKELDVASLSLEGALMLFNKFNAEWTIASFVKYRGYGYKALSKLQHEWESLSLHLKNLLVFIRIPGLNGNSAKTWWDWFNSMSLTKIRDPSIEELQSMMDKLIALYKSTYTEQMHMPMVYTAFSSETDGAVWSYLCKKYVVAATEGGSIWSKTGIGELKTRKSWILDELVLSLKDLTRPIEQSERADHKIISSERVTLDTFVSETISMDREWLETFIGRFLDWDIKAALQLGEIPFNVRKDNLIPRKRVGRWLKWHSATRPSKSGNTLP